MEPEATRSSKPESIVKEIAEKKAKQDADAHTYPISGTLVGAVILNAEGDTVFTTVHDPALPCGDASYRVLRWLAQSRAYEPIAGVDPTADCGVRLFGFHIAERLPVLLFDAMGYAREAPAPVDIPLGLWYHEPFGRRPWADPFHMVIPSERRDKDIDRQGLCDYLGIPCPDDLMEDPAEQARVARAIAVRLQLFPVRPDMQ